MAQVEAREGRLTIPETGESQATQMLYVNGVLAGVGPGCHRGAAALSLLPEAELDAIAPLASVREPNRDGEQGFLSGDGYRSYAAYRLTGVPLAIYSMPTDSSVPVRCSLSCWDGHVLKHCGDLLSAPFGRAVAKAIATHVEQDDLSAAISQRY